MLLSDSTSDVDDLALFFFFLEVAQVHLKEKDNP